ncbi:helix-turn-helix domain-containing protein [Microbacterium sp.]|uniref:AraC family transcriptional regulator n=1 Tax=Microbacterium sp. TaxID=51671 RepID=UPI00281213AA|nr:helix-turn-helix domain-containing protein [Microbacterium sp.]
MPIESIHRSSDSPYVSRVWRGLATGPDAMTSVATSTWELVFWDDRDGVHAAVRGPEAGPTEVAIAEDSETFGITFAHGAVMPLLSPSQLVDAHRESPRTTARTFRLGGEDWEIPAIDDAELLVQRLVRAGLLQRDPLVEDVVCGGVARVGARSVQRRVLSATGLTHGTIRQVERAREAALLLMDGLPAAQVAHLAGYYDQPHLARSLRRFIGRSATQLQSQGGHAMSLLYKTEHSAGS